MKPLKTKKRAMNMGALLGLSLLLMGSAFVHSSATDAQDKLATKEVNIDNFMFTQWN
jgi:hypothetical protein